MTSFSEPTNEQVDEALPFLSSPQHEAYFFSHLKNPLWIAPLARRGVFKYPPPAVRVEGGGIRFPPWAPSQYLARMAPLAPCEVAQLFAEFNTDNATIVGQMLKAALAMPAAYSVSLVDAIKRAIANDALWVYFKDASELCRQLIKAGDTQAGLNLMLALFTPQFREGRDEPSQRIAYWYKDGLTTVAPAMARARAAEVLPVLCKWMAAAVRAKSYVDIRTGRDFSTTWRPAIEEHKDNRDFDFAGVMVGIVRAAFEEAIQSEAISLSDALVILDGQVFWVFKRLRVHVINECADSDPALARRTIVDRLFFDAYETMHEYAMLVGRRWKCLTLDEQAEWLSWVDAGPDMSDFGESFKDNRERDAIEADRKARIDWWKYERLYWIRDQLSGQHLSFYERMRLQYGEPESGNGKSRAVRRRDESPMEVEELSSRSFAETVEVVSTWRPASSRYGDPNVEGLSSTFNQYLATDRVAFSGQAEVMKNRPAIFVRGFIQQMTIAIGEGESINVDAVLSLCQWVVAQPVGERTVVRQDDEALIDADWQWTRNTVSELVKAVCKAQSESRPRFPLGAVRMAMWDLLKELCRDSSVSDIGHNRDEEDPRTKDYLSCGINSPRGKAVEAALEYARWVGSHLKVAEQGQEVVPGGFDAMPEVRDMLEWQIDPANRTVVALSILGSRVGILYWVDRDWLEAKAAALFDLNGIERVPRAAEGWAAWNAFLVWVPPHIEFYRRFRSQFAYAVEQASSEFKFDDRTSEQPMYHLGEHLMLLYGRGQLGFDDDHSVLRRFIETAEPHVRRHAIGFVGRSLRGDDELPGDIVTRFMTLWEVYWAGPGKQDTADRPEAWLFGIWFSSGKFPDQWSIDQLLKFVQVAPMAEPDHAVVERLAEICEADIHAATKVLDRMVRGDTEGWRVGGWAEFAVEILRRAMAAGGEVQQDAESLINFLGRRGYTDFGKLLNEM